jgi:hypothetical protein
MRLLGKVQMMHSFGVPQWVIAICCNITLYRVRKILKPRTPFARCYEMNQRGNQDEPSKPVSTSHRSAGSTKSAAPDGCAGAARCDVCIRGGGYRTEVWRLRAARTDGDKVRWKLPSKKRLGIHLHSAPFTHGGHMSSSDRPPPGYFTTHSEVDGMREPFVNLFRVIAQAIQDAEMHCFDPDTGIDEGGEYIAIKVYGDISELRKRTSVDAIREEAKKRGARVT